MNIAEILAVWFFGTLILVGLDTAIFRLRSHGK
jgi:hypothetical protein